MSELMEWLEETARKESKVRAVLKRSLAFKPGTYPASFPYIEWRLTEKDGEWKRTVHYLAAGLWAQNWRESHGSKLRLAVACRNFFQTHEKSPSMEKRFIVLLDADGEQLAYRLRQMVALLTDYNIDFDALLTDLFSWKHPDRFIQTRWARDFYNN